MIEEILTEMKSLADPALSAHQQIYFKAGRGGYGEGDCFLGLTVPQVRKISKKYSKKCDENCLNEMLKSTYHDIRLAALLIMIEKFEQGKPEEQCRLYQLYLDNIPAINNWDLVDISAAKIVGAYIYPNPEILWKLADKNHLWSQRIAMLASNYFVQKGDYAPTLRLAEKFIASQHDLMHKASGWILREVGKKDLGSLCRFLDQNAAKMPRTMLRYAVEKLEPSQRQTYLAQKTLRW